MYALVQGAWAAPMTDSDRAYEQAEGTIPFRASSHPKRQEIVLVSLADASHLEVHQATIERFADKPPRLGPFELIGDTRKSQDIESRFDLREGLGPQLSR